MEIEYRLYHRVTHKNGHVNDWVMDCVTRDPELVKFYVDFNTKGAHQLGKSIEHKVQAREVSSWYDYDLDKILKSDENKEAK